MTVLVTGGAGFIGSNLLHSLVELGDDIVCVDSLTYAGDRKKYSFICYFICD